MTTKPCDEDLLSAWLRCFDSGVCHSLWWFSDPRRTLDRIRASRDQHCGVEARFSSIRPVKEARRACAHVSMRIPSGPTSGDGCSRLQSSGTSGDEDSRPRGGAIANFEDHGRSEKRNSWLMNRLASRTSIPNRKHSESKSRLILPFMSRGSSVTVLATPPGGYLGI